MNSAHVRLRRDGAILRRCRQRGITVIIALLVLVAMTLAGLALIRSVDTATLVAGNLAFRQSAVSSSDDGLEAAIGALRGMSDVDRESDNAGSAYYASFPATVDFTGNGTTASGDNFDWSKAKTLPADDVGNTASYVIHRLCNQAGALSASYCTTWQDVKIAVGGQGALAPDERGGDTTLQSKNPALRGYYRITVRISGPRHTVSYVQAIVMIV